MEKNYKKIMYSGILLGILYIINKMKKEPFEGIIFTGTPRTLSINSPYGMRGGKLHKGLDLFGNIGDKVFVKKGGDVLRYETKCRVGNMRCGGGWGNFVEIQHTPNIKTIYAHLTDVFVKTGDIIKPNQVIGTIGNTGHSFGKHLHWEYWENGRPKNGQNIMNNYVGIEKT